MSNKINESTVYLQTDTRAVEKKKQLTVMEKKD